MKKTFISSALVAALVFTSFGVAHADTKAAVDVGLTTHHVGGWGGMSMGSTTGMHGGMQHASSTNPMRGQMFQGAGAFGLVTEVDGDHFLLASRGMNQATTTYTVNVTSSTKFMEGSTTKAYSDVTTGSRVAVLGPIATSTKSITAEHVMLGVGDRMDMGQGNSPGTGDQKKGFLGKIKNIVHSLFGWL